MADDKPIAIKAIPLPKSYGLNFMAMARTPEFDANGDIITLQLWSDGVVTWSAQDKDGNNIGLRKLEEWTEELDGRERAEQAGGVPGNA